MVAGSRRRSSAYNHAKHAANLKQAADSDVLDGIIDGLASATRDDKVAVLKFIHAMEDVGLLTTDPRLQPLMIKLKAIVKESGHLLEIDENPTVSNDELYQDVWVSKAQLKACLENSVVLVTKAFRNELVIEEPSSFLETINEIYKKCASNTQGKINTEFAQFEKFSQDNWGVSICTIDGQRFSVGDTKVRLPMLTLVTAINYAIALEEMGADKVHRFVGQEPSGRSCMEISLDSHRKPHNPLIDTGATVVAALLKPEAILADRFDHLQSIVKRMAGGEEVGYNNSIYLAKRANANRNFALGYFMNENHCYPPDTKLLETLELYFSLLALESSPETLSVIAATLANGGICPTTGERIFGSEAMRNTLSVMYSCGMYDYSGKFSFYIGLPAKSATNGCIMLIVPNVMGLCLWSPALDKYNNSVRGIQFCQELVSSKLCESIQNASRAEENLHSVKTTVNILFAAQKGDVSGLYRFYLAGCDMNKADYDGRTALHLAAAEGQIDAVKFLLKICKANPEPKDRWNFAPSDDAKRFNHFQVVRILEREVQKRKQMEAIAEPQ